MTFSCASVMEWIVGCERDLVAARSVRRATDITCHKFGPKADNPRKLLKPLLSSLLWFVKRSRVSCVAIVLVQVLGDKVQVPLLESLTPSVHEFNLWGIGAFWLGHWGTVQRQGRPLGPRTTH